MTHKGWCVVKLQQNQSKTPIFSFPEDNLCWGILTKVGTCIDNKEIWFGIINGQIPSMFDRVICLRHNNSGVLFFNVFIWYGLTWPKILLTVLLNLNLNKQMGLAFSQIYVLQYLLGGNRIWAGLCGSVGYVSDCDQEVAGSIPAGSDKILS